MSPAARRMPEAGRAALRRLYARLRDERQAEATARALEELECTLFLREYEQAYTDLREDPEAWAEVEAERAAWDGTLADGLEDEEGPA